MDDEAGSRPIGWRGAEVRFVGSAVDCRLVSGRGVLSPKEGIGGIRGPIRAEGKKIDSTVEEKRIRRKRSENVKESSGIGRGKRKEEGKKNEKKRE